MQKKIPVLACEGPCIRGDIARRAANMVGKEEQFALACYPEAFFVPHSSMVRWVKEADKVVMVDGCYLQCIGRVLNNLVDQEKIVHIEALQLYKKYIDIFDMDQVPEAERIDTARQVAESDSSQPERYLRNRRNGIIDVESIFFTQTLPTLHNFFTSSNHNTGIKLKQTIGRTGD